MKSERNAALPVMHLLYIFLAPFSMTSGCDLHKALSCLFGAYCEVELRLAEG